MTRHRWSGLRIKKEVRMYTTGFDFDVITGPSIPRNESGVAENADTRVEPATAERSVGDEGGLQR